MPKIRISYCLSAICLAIACLAPTATPANSNGCKDVYLIFARGSGDSLNGENYRSFKSSVAQTLSGKNINYAFYELGSNSYNGHRYPAADVNASSFKGFMTALGAFVSGGGSYSFGHSVNEGEQEIYGFIKDYNNSCPNTKYVLAGYSQGALVVSESLKLLNPDQIIYAATFGDPKLYLPEGAGANPAACRKNNSSFSDYRAYVPDCKAYEGILGGRKPYVSTQQNWLGKVGTWCNYHDIMCSTRIDSDDIMRAHTSYISDHRYEHAAELIARKITATLGLSELETELRSTKDIVFVIDSSNATPSLLAQYRDTIVPLTKLIFGSGGRIALYNLNTSGSHELCSFTTCDYNTFSTKISQIQPSLNNGSLYQAALSAMNEQNWSIGANKQIVLFSNSGLNPGGLSLSSVTKRSLEIDPVHINIVTNTSELLLDPAATQLVVETGGQLYNFDSDMGALEDNLVSLTPEGSVTPDETAREDCEINIISHTIADDNLTINLAPTTHSVLLLINQQIYGFLGANQITITDLDFSLDNEIMLVPFTASGERGHTTLLQIPSTHTQNQASAPNIGLPRSGFKNNHEN